jgi:hypothetical protein
LDYAGSRCWHNIAISLITLGSWCNACLHGKILGR